MCQNIVLVYLSRYIAKECTRACLVPGLSSPWVGKKAKEKKDNAAKEGL